ncbi:TonB-dependent receptor plug domain-containing protein [Salidesulfovibrio onnuriiensis]|uniref:TonB-dependent receptor plug domain-containing protein n=1 Tax=Salidesulfovibrio onnuriiensis TaxID=2583823 RepID=UPI0011C92AEA|nr:TonB-dependent receptor plug domain-containing protein [Salidesulfovibrio onnuriiensis]
MSLFGFFNRKNKTSWLILCLLGGLAFSPAYASEEAVNEVGRNDNATENVVRLEAVDVDEERDESGKAALDRQSLERMPNSTGSVTEALKVMPNVQFDDSSRSSLNGGSILAPKISISGGKYYENNFSIDGVSNNNRIDPYGIDETPANGLVYGEAENAYIDTELLESITVYSSNVPAQYGQFVGGMVDAETRKPASEFGGKISYQHTRDTWANQRPADREEFEGSTTNSQGNPKFSKHNVSAYMDLPMSDTAGAILSYSLKHSTVPLFYMEDRRNQYSTKNDVFGKLSLDVTDKSSLDISVLFDTYSSTKFVADTKDSDYELEKPTRKVTLKYENELEPGTFTLTTAFSETETRRDSEATEHITWTKGGGTTSTQWGSHSTNANEGGYGSTYTRQRDLTMAMDYVSVPVAMWSSSNVLNSGFVYENVSGVYDQENDFVTYYSPTTSGNVIDNGEGGVIAGEQYTRLKSMQAKGKRSTGYNSFAYYMQDELSWKRLRVRPGARLEYDDLLENINLAPRFTAELDVLGDQDLVFTAGANRYYGANLLSYALRVRNPLQRYSRTIDGAGNLSSWTATTSSQYDYSLDGLNTPYSDELMFGVRGDLFGLDASLEWVKRKGHEQFATSMKNISGIWKYKLTNDGETEYWGYTLKLAKTIDDHRFSLGITHSDQETNFNDFSDSNNDGSSSSINYDKVYYNGSLIDRSQMPASNFNRPWVGTFTYEGTFFDKLKFTNVTRYLGEVETIFAKGTQVVGGEKYLKYEDATLSPSVIWDWKFGYELWSNASQALQLDLTIDNVFDDTAIIDKESNRAAGRQFWAGASYTF